jgi:hypothetical protein
VYNTNRRDQLASITYNDGTSGKLGFVYNGIPYYYIRNVLGDINGILDANGNLVAEYKYDAWGNCTVTLDTLGVGASLALVICGLGILADNLYGDFKEKLIW